VQENSTTAVILSVYKPWYICTRFSTAATKTANVFYSSYLFRKCQKRNSPADHNRICNVTAFIVGCFTVPRHTVE